MGETMIESQPHDLLEKGQSKTEQQTQQGRITLAYESLFDMVVREKGRDGLQQLSQSFFTDLVGYLNEKRGTLSLLGSEEKEKTARQLQNINRLVKELYERREKKIIGLALARSRAGVDIIDTSALLGEEKAMFDGLVRQLDNFRDNVLNNILLGKHPAVSYSQTGAETLAAASKIITSAPVSAIGGAMRVGEAAAAAEASESAETGGEGKAERAEGAEGAEGAGKATRLVRLLHPVPRFVGKELEVYGPFDREDIANLPREIADVLIAKGRAEEMAQA